MSEVPVEVGGAITIALIVCLGIFVYPWLLAHRYGAWIVAVITLLLAGLFVTFQIGASGSGSGLYPVVMAAAWALGPVVAGVIVWRLQRNTDEGSSK
jgi:hypothetical protein